MPTYDYVRADGSSFEIIQKMSDPPLKKCPTTGQKVTRAIGAGAGLIFKGSGFYETDYVKKSGSNDSSEEANSKTSTTEISSKDKKPASKTKAKKAKK